MGSPIESGTWNGVEAGYYIGLGSGEALWLFVSIALCVVALVVGHRHESSAYKNAARKKSTATKKRR